MASPRVILISGSRRGIGAGLVSYFLERGDTVIGCSRGPSDLSHKQHTHFELDVADERAVKQMFRDVREAHGRLDILINNAGIASMNHTLLTPVESVRRIFDTNVIGTFLMCREAAKLMRRARFGRIINLSTVAVPLRLEGEAVYASSKAAVEMLTRVLAKECSELGITVNAVGPSPIKTDMLKGVSEDKMDAIINQQPLREWATVHDVANVAEFFARPESRFVTGQVIYLGGF